MHITVIAVVTVVVATGTFAAHHVVHAANKTQRHTANKERVQVPRTPRDRTRFGYEASPERHPMGSRDWWRAMEREGRGGFGDTM